MSTPLHDNAPPGSRALELLRALRRTGVAHEAEADTINRILGEVHPTQDDLLAALSDAMHLSESDPARPRMIALLNAMLRTGRFRTG